MKFTSEDLAKAMGVKVGDIIKVNWPKGNKIYKITEYYDLRDQEDFYIRLTEIINQDYEILPRKKKVGEQLCGKIGCADCPLHGINCVLESIEYLSLYERLKAWHRKYKDDKLYNELKARLDKEVEE